MWERTTVSGRLMPSYLSFAPGPEPIADEQVEWRGQIHHTVSGISHYFRDWEQFGYLLEEIFFDLAEEGE